MYISLYTYIYTTDPDTVHFHWEINDPIRFSEIKHIFAYYDKLNIFESCACRILNLTKEAMEEVMILMGAEKSTVKEEEFQRVCPMLEAAMVTNDEPVRDFMVTPGVLGYVTLFNQNWYVPLFESTTLVCKPVPTHLPSSALLRWYEESIQESELMPYDKTIWDRCAALIASVSVDDMPMIVTDNVNMVDNVIEDIDSYLMLYLEPSKNKEVLLSEVYQDYKKHVPASEITQAAFIKQLRTHSRFTIVRYSSGMVIKNYMIMRSYHIVKYMSFNDIHSANHMAIVKQYSRKFPMVKLSYAREAFFLLSVSTTIEPTYSMIRFFIAEPKTENILKECNRYLTLLEKYDDICHDDLNEMSEERKQLFQSASHMESFFPFSSFILTPAMADKTTHQSLDSTFMNQYSYE